jgi:hypothetical protein
MTPYVTLAEYFQISNKFPDMTDCVLLEASQKVDFMCLGRVGDLSDLTPYQLDKVKIATCYQADYLLENKDIFEQEDISNYSVLGMSVSFGPKDYYGKNRISKKAYESLIPTSLLWKGV